MILGGSFVMAAAFKSIDAASNPAWIWIATWIGFLLAAFLIAQGTVLLLTGQWLT